MAQTFSRSLHSPCVVSCPIPIPFIVPKDQAHSENFEIFRNTVRSYGVLMLAPRQTNKLQFATSLFSILTATFLPGRHLLHSNLRLGHSVLSKTNIDRLAIHSR